MPPTWPESSASPDPSGHPTRDELEGFLTGALGRPARPRILRHLLAGCPECTAICRPILAGLDPRFALEVDESAYDAPIDRVRARFAARAGIETRAEAETRARQDLVTLFTLPDELAARRPRRPEPTREYQLAWIGTLTEGAKSMRGDEPHTGAYLANAALCSALALAEKQPPEPELWDLTARARAEKANAWRLLGYTAEAIEQLELARTEALQGTGDPRLIAEIASLEASVFIAARQFERAEELLDLLEDRYRQEGDMAALGKILMQRGNLCYCRGDYEASASDFVRAFDSLRVGGQIEMAGLAFKNAIDALVRCGLYAEASEFLPTVRLHLEKHANETERRKLRWLEAKCAAGLGHLAPAEGELRAIAQEFDAAEQPYHRSLVVLDLCGVWLAQGRSIEIAEAARYLLQSFAELDVEREAVHALALLEQAARQERATAALLLAAIRQVEGLPLPAVRRER